MVGRVGFRFHAGFSEFALESHSVFDMPMSRRHPALKGAIRWNAPGGSATSCAGVMQESCPAAWRHAKRSRFATATQCWRRGPMFKGRQADGPAGQWARGKSARRRGTTQPAFWGRGDFPERIERAMGPRQIRCCRWPGRAVPFDDDGVTLADNSRRVSPRRVVKNFASGAMVRTTA